MEYRSFGSLRGDEIQEFMDVAMKEFTVDAISYDKIDDSFKVACHSTWVSESDDGEFISEDLDDTITLYDDGIYADFQVLENEERLWQQFLLAKGCDWRLRNNPFLKD